MALPSVPFPNQTITSTGGRGVPSIPLPSPTSYNPPSFGSPNVSNARASAMGSVASTLRSLLEARRKQQEEEEKNARLAELMAGLPGGQSQQSALSNVATAKALNLDKTQEGPEGFMHSLFKATSPLGIPLAFLFGGREYVKNETPIGRAIEKWNTDETEGLNLVEALEEPAQILSLIPTFFGSALGIEQWSDSAKAAGDAYRAAKAAGKDNARSIGYEAGQKHTSEAYDRTIGKNIDKVKNLEDAIGLSELLTEVGWDKSLGKKWNDDKSSVFRGSGIGTLLDTLRGASVFGGEALVDPSNIVNPGNAAGSVASLGARALSTGGIAARYADDVIAAGGKAAAAKAAREAFEEGTQFTLSQIGKKAAPSVAEYADVIKGKSVTQIADYLSDFIDPQMAVEIANVQAKNVWRETMTGTTRSAVQAAQPTVREVLEEWGTKTAASGHWFKEAVATTTGEGLKGWRLREFEKIAPYLDSAWGTLDKSGQKALDNYARRMSSGYGLISFQVPFTKPYVAIGGGARSAISSLFSADKLDKFARVGGRGVGYFLTPRFLSVNKRDVIKLGSQALASYKYSADNAVQALANVSQYVGAKSVKELNDKIKDAYVQLGDKQAFTKKGRARQIDALARLIGYSKEEARDYAYDKSALEIGIDALYNEKVVPSRVMTKEGVSRYRVVFRDGTTHMYDTIEEATRARDDDIDRLIKDAEAEYERATQAATRNTPSSGEEGAAPTAAQVSPGPTPSAGPAGAASEPPSTLGSFLDEAAEKTRLLEDYAQQNGFASYDEMPNWRKGQAGKWVKSELRKLVGEATPSETPSVTVPKGTKKVSVDISTQNADNSVQVRVIADGIEQTPDTPAKAPVFDEETVGVSAAAVDEAIKKGNIQPTIDASLKASGYTALTAEQAERVTDKILKAIAKVSEEFPNNPRAQHNAVQTAVLDEFIAQSDDDVFREYWRLVKDAVNKSPARLGKKGNLLGVEDREKAFLKVAEYRWKNIFDDTDREMMMNFTHTLEDGTEVASHRFADDDEAIKALANLEKAQWLTGDASRITQVDGQNIYDLRNVRIGQSGAGTIEPLIGGNRIDIVNEDAHFAIVGKGGSYGEKILDVLTGTIKNKNGDKEPVVVLRSAPVRDPEKVTEKIIRNPRQLYNEYLGEAGDLDDDARREGLARARRFFDRAVSLRAQDAPRPVLSASELEERGLDAWRINEALRVRASRTMRVAGTDELITELKSRGLDVDSDGFITSINKQTKRNVDVNNFFFVRKRDNVAGAVDENGVQVFMDELWYVDEVINEEGQRVLRAREVVYSGAGYKGKRKTKIKFEELFSSVEGDEVVEGSSPIELGEGLRGYRYSNDIIGGKIINDVLSRHYMSQDVRFSHPLGLFLGEPVLDGDVRRFLNSTQDMMTRFGVRRKGRSYEVVSKRPNSTWGVEARYENPVHAYADMINRNYEWVSTLPSATKRTFQYKEVDIDSYAGALTSIEEKLKVNTYSPKVINEPVALFGSVTADARRGDLPSMTEHAFFTNADGDVVRAGYIAIKGKLYPEIYTRWTGEDYILDWGAIAETAEGARRLGFEVTDQQFAAIVTPRGRNTNMSPEGIAYVAKLMEENPNFVELVEQGLERDMDTLNATIYEDNLNVMPKSTDASINRQQEKKLVAEDMKFAMKYLDGKAKSPARDTSAIEREVENLENQLAALPDSPKYREEVRRISRQIGLLEESLKESKEYDAAVAVIMDGVVREPFVLADRLFKGIENVGEAGFEASKRLNVVVDQISEEISKLIKLRRDVAGSEAPSKRVLYDAYNRRIEVLKRYKDKVTYDYKVSAEELMQGQGKRSVKRATSPNARPDNISRSLIMFDDRTAALWDETGNGKWEFVFPSAGRFPESSYNEPWSIAGKGKNKGGVAIRRTGVFFNADEVSGARSKYNTYSPEVQQKFADQGVMGFGVEQTGLGLDTVDGTVHFFNRVFDEVHPAKMTEQFKAAWADHVETPMGSRVPLERPVSLYNAPQEFTWAKTWNDSWLDEIEKDVYLQLQRARWQGGQDTLVGRKGIAKANVTREMTEADYIPSLGAMDMVDAVYSSEMAMARARISTAGASPEYVKMLHNTLDGIKKQIDELGGELPETATPRREEFGATLKNARALAVRSLKRRADALEELIEYSTERQRPDGHIPRGSTVTEVIQKNAESELPTLLKERDELVARMTEMEELYSQHFGGFENVNKKLITTEEPRPEGVDVSSLPMEPWQNLEKTYQDVDMLNQKIERYQAVLEESRAASNRSAEAKIAQDKVLNVNRNSRRFTRWDAENGEAVQPTSRKPAGELGKTIEEAKGSSAGSRPKKPTGERHYIPDMDVQGDWEDVDLRGSMHMHQTGVPTGAMNARRGKAGAGGSKRTTFPFLEKVKVSDDVWEDKEDIVREVVDKIKTFDERGTYYRLSQDKNTGDYLLKKTTPKRGDVSQKTMVVGRFSSLDAVRDHLNWYGDEFYETGVKTGAIKGKMVKGKDGNDVLVMAEKARHVIDEKQLEVAVSKFRRDGLLNAPSLDDTEIARIFMTIIDQEDEAYKAIAKREMARGLEYAQDIEDYYSPGYVPAGKKLGKQDRKIMKALGIDEAKVKQRMTKLNEVKDQTASGKQTNLPARLAQLFDVADTGDGHIMGSLLGGDFQKAKQISDRSLTTRMRSREHLPFESNIVKRMETRASAGEMVASEQDIIAALAATFGKKLYKTKDSHYIFDEDNTRKAISGSLDNLYNSRRVIKTKNGNYYVTEEARDIFDAVFNRQYTLGNGPLDIAAKLTSQVFVPMMTVFNPAFVFNNTIGNIDLGMRNGMLDHESLGAAGRIIRYLRTMNPEDANIKIYGVKYSATPNFEAGERNIDELVDSMLRTGTLTFSGRDPYLMDSGLEKIGGIYDTKVLGDWVKFWRSINTNSENTFRSASFLKATHKYDIDPEVAAKVVNDIYFDYSKASLTQTESKIRQLIPFYNWTRKNYPATVKFMMKKPGLAYNMYVRGPLAFSTNPENEDEDVSVGQMADFWHNSLTPFQKQGGVPIISPDGTYTPLRSTFNDVFQGMNLVNQLVKGAKGENPDWFNDIQDFTSGFIGPVVKMGAQAIVGKDEYGNDFIEEDESGPFGTTGFLGGALRTGLESIPGISRFANAARSEKQYEETRGRKGNQYAWDNIAPNMPILTDLISAASGGKIGGYDPDIGPSMGSFMMSASPQRIDQDKVNADRLKVADMRATEEMDKYEKKTGLALPRNDEGMKLYLTELAPAMPNLNAEQQQAVQEAQSLAELENDIEFSDMPVDERMMIRSRIKLRYRELFSTIFPDITKTQYPLFQKNAGMTGINLSPTQQYELALSGAPVNPQTLYDMDDRARKDAADRYIEMIMGGRQ